MKKILIMLFVLLLMGSVCAAGASCEPVMLDYSTIISGSQLFYSGSIDGGESGIFVMNADGSDPRMLTDLTANLMAESGGNLLIYLHETEAVNASMAVLRADGTIQPLEGVSSGAALASEGRFYWGAGSCAEDGSDLQLYFSGDNVNQYDYYPMAVDNGYLYYLDWSEMSGLVFSEGSSQPQGAALCRMNLTDRSCEVISSIGANYLGLENGKIFYTRTNFWKMDDSFEPVEVTVDQGLFATDLATLSETRLAEYPAEANAVDSYAFMKDGVVYGMRSSFSEDADGDYCILRIQADGTQLDSIPVSEDSWITLSCVDRGILYVSECYIESSEDDFIQKDRIIAINLTDGTQTVLNPDSIDMLFYSEIDPAVAVAGGRIYYSAYDMERWSVCLKSMNIDGSDLRLLAHGISFAEG